MVEFKNTVLIPIDISAELTKDSKLMAILGNGKKLSCLIRFLEQPVFAYKIRKFHDVIFFGSFTHVRTLIITYNALYTIKRHTLKRKIPIRDVIGLTKAIPPSPCTEEFTIHVNKSYDIRYETEK